jgi:hypothetical protein
MSVSLRLASAGLLVAVVGCGSAYNVSIVEAGTGRQIGDSRVGDTLRLLATIYHDPRWPSDAPTSARARSDSQPNLFTWSTFDSTTARVVAPGVVVMRAPGYTTIHVRTASATALEGFNVFAAKP